MWEAINEAMNQPVTFSGLFWVLVGWVTARLACFAVFGN